MLKLILFVCFTVNVLVDSIPLKKTIIESHVVGGNDTDITQVPYHVAIFDLGTYSCGGTIVSPTHILTSAFCLFTSLPEEFFIRAGSTYANKGGVTAKVKKIQSHPKYDINTGDYDIGIMELETPLKIDNKTIKPIKLATKEPGAGTLALVNGWGYSKNDTVHLKSATHRIRSRADCTACLKPHNFIFTPRMICGKTEGAHEFPGDTGSSLAYKGEMVGIVSEIFKDEGDHLPEIYTNIADPDIMKFIKDATKL